MKNTFTQAQINALETRFKSTTLMIFNIDVLSKNEKLDDGIDIACNAFDSENYDLCTKILDLMNLSILKILEL